MIYHLSDNLSGWKTLAATFTPGSATAQAAITATYGDEAATIGLDNVYRLNAQASGGQIAIRGNWTDDHTFVVHELVMGEINEFDIRMDFSDTEVAVHVEETVFGQLADDFTGTTHERS